MVGITSYGAYVPIYRLSREAIAQAWGGASAGGERSVANMDEDSITMAVAAAIDCLDGMDRNTIDGVYFATTTSPYREKQVAVVFSNAVDLRRDIFTGDFSDSLRSGTIALRAAVDAVKAGSAKKVLVTAADCRLAEPKSEFEQVFGDGAAAVVIGDSGVAASIEASYSHADEIHDIWRTRKDEIVKSWEDRFVFTEGYLLNLQEALSAIMRNNKLGPKDFAKVVYYAPDARRHQDIARSLGFDYKTQVQDPLFDRLGNTGSALALMLLVAALETAKPGDRILFANYGDGSDAFILRVTDQIEKIRDQNRRGIKGHLASKRLLGNYERYIRFRELMPVELQRRPELISYVPVLWRDRRWVLGGCASRCKNCGRHFFPPQRVCLYCRTKDSFDYVRISDWKGKLFTFSKDNLALSVDPPTIWSIVDLEDKVRIYTRMTDADPEKVDVDMPVELTFRKLHEAGGRPNYFWKCRPIR